MRARALSCRVDPGLDAGRLGGYEAPCRREPRPRQRAWRSASLARESLLTLGRAPHRRGRPEDGALQLFDEAEQAAGRDAGNAAAARHGALQRGLPRARRAATTRSAEALRVGRACRARRCGATTHGAARSLAALGSVALHEHRHRRRRRARCARASSLANRIGDRGIMAWALELLGDTLRRDPSRSAPRACSARRRRYAKRSRARSKGSSSRCTNAGARRRSSLPTSTDAWASGRELSPDDAAAFAL